KSSIVNRPSDPQLLHFLVVILPIENVPLGRAFDDRALLALDLRSRSFIDSFFLGQQPFERRTNLLPDSLWVFDELDVFDFFDRLEGCLGDLVRLIAADSHSTALY